MTGSFEHLSVSVTDSGVATVIVDRPPANALNRALMAEFTEMGAHLEQVRPRLVLLRSASDRFFMAGADLQRTGEHWDVMDETVRMFQETVNEWERLSMPTVAVIEGHALGGGLEIALACDLRIMVTGRATIGLPEVRWSVLACGGGTQRLARLVGRGQALSMVMRGLRIGAAEAERIGLATVACPPDELASTLAALAAEFAVLPPLAVSAAKRAIIRGLDVTVEEGMRIEAAEMKALAATADAREGVAAFNQKRAPRYVGA